MNAVTQITPAGLKALMDAKSPFCLLDVREPWELALARVEGSLSIPLNEIPARLKELEQIRDDGTLATPAGGGGSGTNSQRLGRVSNLQGGIEAWARDIDPQMPTY